MWLLTCLSVCLSVSLFDWTILMGLLNWAFADLLSLYLITQRNCQPGSLSVCLSVCPTVRLFVYPSVCLCLCLSACLFNPKDGYFLLEILTFPPVCLPVLYLNNAPILTRNLLVENVISQVLNYKRLHFDI